ncbi:NAD-dependent epimerase/dehydratase family protein [Saccharicrinis fermentans]|uniref:NAD-dependent epimerase/dehydratase family protein n=1 Tax=Saccharicrinis fermentans TaxID=982 RepID=UPI00190F4941
MKVLLTGATGYVGKRLLPVLVQAGYQVVCCVRDKRRFSPEHHWWIIWKSLRWICWRRIP